MLVELAGLLVVSRVEPQLRLISTDEARVHQHAFRTLPPLCTLKAAADFFRFRSFASLLS